MNKIVKFSSLLMAAAVSCLCMFSCSKEEKDEPAESNDTIFTQWYCTDINGSWYDEYTVDGHYYQYEQYGDVWLATVELTFTVVSGDKAEGVLDFSGTTAEYTVKDGKLSVERSDGSYSWTGKTLDKAIVPGKAGIFNQWSCEDSDAEWYEMYEKDKYYQFIPQSDGSATISETLDISFVSGDEYSGVYQYEDWYYKYSIDGLNLTVVELGSDKKETGYSWKGTLVHPYTIKK